MRNLGNPANERARAELRAVEETAVKLALIMARFRQEAERLAALLRELDTPQGSMTGAVADSLPPAA
jgi:hypothetical protein